MLRKNAIKLIVPECNSTAGTPKPETTKNAVIKYPAFFQPRFLQQQV